MPAPKRASRAASAPRAPEPAATAPAAATPAPSPAAASSVIERLDAAVRAAETRGDHTAHAALSELHNAAGLLKAKAATRSAELTGADAALARLIQSLL